MKKSPTPVPTIDKAQKRKAEPLKKEKVPLKKPEGTKKPELKRQDSKKPEEDCAQSEPTVPAVSEKERIRSGIRKSLNELFTLRLKDVADLNITAEEVFQIYVCFYVGRLVGFYCHDIFISVYINNNFYSRGNLLIINF